MVLWVLFNIYSSSLGRADHILWKKIPTSWWGKTDPYGWFTSKSHIIDNFVSFSSLGLNQPRRETSHISRWGLLGQVYVDDEETERLSVTAWTAKPHGDHPCFRHTAKSQRPACQIYTSAPRSPQIRWLITTTSAFLSLLLPTKWFLVLNINLKALYTVLKEVCFSPVSKHWRTIKGVWMRTDYQISISVALRIVSQKRWCWGQHLEKAAAIVQTWGSTLSPWLGENRLGYAYLVGNPKSKQSTTEIYLPFMRPIPCGWAEASTLLSQEPRLWNSLGQKKTAGGPFTSSSLLQLPNDPWAAQFIVLI